MINAWKVEKACALLQSIDQHSTSLHTVTSAFLEYYCSILFPKLFITLPPRLKAVEALLSQNGHHQKVYK